MTRLRAVALGLGTAAVVAGAALIILPLLGVWQRGQADQSALTSWNRGGSQALTGPAAISPTATAHAVACGSGSVADYALVTFGAPAAEHYGGVATDGTWASLHDRSMVHYTGTPAPGGAGNSIFAFHREPDFEHIDELAVGDTVTIQDRTCATYTYQVTGRWTLPPNRVTQLQPTAGHELTLITCTPFWVDTQRIVWRATLVSSTPAA